MQCVDLGGRRIIKKIFFKQKTAYEIMPSLVGSEMCIRDRKSTGRGGELNAVPTAPEPEARFCSIDNPDCEACQ